MKTGQKLCRSKGWRAEEEEQRCVCVLGCVCGAGGWAPEATVQDCTVQYWEEEVEEKAPARGPKKGGLAEMLAAQRWMWALLGTGIGGTLAGQRQPQWIGVQLAASGGSRGQARGGERGAAEGVWATDLFLASSLLIHIN